MQRPRRRKAVGDAKRVDGAMVVNRVEGDFQDPPVGRGGQGLALDSEGERDAS